MFLVSPEETPYDLKWRMFRISVRVHPLFWLVAGILSFDWVRMGIPHLLVAVACIFLSILVHELGHVVVGRWFGSYGHIVLYGFGGLAIGSNNLERRWQRVLVLFAGPGAQFLLLVLVCLASYAAYGEWVPDVRAMLITLLRGESDIPAQLLFVTISTLYFVNLVWPILNLLPVWPLDGGQIAREWFTYFTPRNGVRFALHLSIGVSVLLALHALLSWQQGRTLLIPYITEPFHAIFFALFAVTGIQALQAEEYQRRSFDPWDHERW